MTVVNEAIVATADDGKEYGGNWYSTSYFVTVGNSDGSFHGGFRFQTVDVPQGATINSATLKLFRNSGGGTVGAQIYGDDVDDAAAWSGANRPTQRTKTTAKTALSAGTPNDEYKNQDVTAIVQEIVNRVGWTNNADMALFVLNTGGPGASVQFDDYSFSGTNHALLDIDYTAGGGAHTGTGLSVVPTPSQNAQGQHPFTGTGLSVVTIPTQDGQGEQPHEGTGLSVSTVPTQNAQGEQPHEGTGLSITTTPVQDAQGQHPFTGTGLSVVTVPTQDGQGIAGFEGTGLSVVPVPSQAAVGILVPTGTGLTVLASTLLTQDAQGEQPHEATGLSIVPVPTQDAQGQHAETGRVYRRGMMIYPGRGMG